MTGHKNQDNKQQNFPSYIAYQCERLMPAARILMIFSVVYLISFGLLDFIKFPDQIRTVVLLRFAASLPLLLLLSFMGDPKKHTLIPKYFLPLGLISFVCYLSLNLIIPEKKQIVSIVPVFYILVVIAMAPLLKNLMLIMTFVLGAIIYYSAGVFFIQDEAYINLVFPYMSAIVLFTLVTVVKIRQSAEDNYQLAKNLHWQSEHDELTKVFNRNGVFSWVKSQGLFVGKSFEPVSLVMLDIDHFKKINDNYGHAVGDEVIKNSAELLVKAMGSNSVVARFGGEEFLLILQEGSESQNLKVAIGILEKFRKTHISDDLKITVSMGFVNHRTRFSFEQSLKTADDFMYKAKSLGRNQLVDAVQ